MASAPPLEYTDSLQSRPNKTKSRTSHGRARETLVFVHGYPDDSSLWKGQVEEFQNDYRCICVTLPEFGKEKISGLGPTPGKVVDLILETLDSIGEPPSSFHLVAHDWGAFYAYLLVQTSPQRVKSLSTIDVGISFSEQRNPLGYLLLPLYQFLLAGGFLADKLPVVGTALGKGITGAVLGGLRLASGKGNFAGPSRVTPFAASQNYPYFQLWRALFTNPSGIRLKTPKIPFFFAFGGAGLKKLMSFHSERWLSKLRDRSDCMVSEFPEAGHWFMKDNPKDYNNQLRAFLARI